MFKVLKPFPYSATGMATRQVEVGETLDISPDLVAGLTAEGFIEKGKGQPSGEAREAADKAAADKAD